MLRWEWDITQQQKNFMKNFLFTALVLCFGAVEPAMAAPSSEQLSRIVGSGAGFYAKPRGGGRPLELRANQAFIPASVMKLVTATAALDHLGPGYTFETEVFGEIKSGGTVERLVVRGAGAPDFTTEDAFLLASTLKRRGVRRIKRLEIDTSALLDPWGPSGERAYQAGVGAASLNYNSFGIEVCPTKKGESAQVGVTPHEYLLPIKGNVSTSSKSGPRVAVSNLPGGEAIKISGTIGHLGDCTTIYRSVQSPWKYFGETLRAMLGEVGVQVVGSVSKGRVTGDLRHLATQHSKPLAQLISLMNKFSNNFIAEHLIFALGRERKGVASYSRGLRRASSFLRSVDQSAFTNVDGSGLSRSNRLTPKGLVEVIHYALSSREFGIEFAASLAVPGRNGTLKSRRFSLPEGALRAKTGTLTGVAALAGIVRASSGKQVVFALIQNAVKDRGSSWSRERRFVEALYEGF